jgi:hypothetical protein
MNLVRKFLCAFEFDRVRAHVKITKSCRVLQVFSSLYRQLFERRWRSVSALRVLEKILNQDVGMLPHMVNVVRKDIRNLLLQVELSILLSLNLT